MPRRVKQFLVGSIGVAIAGVMLWLGLWQMQVFEAKENSSAQARAAQPAVPLLDAAGPSGLGADVYGRRVAVRGTYLAGQDELVIDERGGVRLLTGLQVADGRVLPVVRGALPPADVPPAPPDGEVGLVGVFLPSEAAADNPSGSVRLAALAQRWPQPLVPGFVTVDADQVEAGLRPAAIVLPSGAGSWQNYGYALQWWVFAAFAIFMTIRFVRAIGGQGTLGSTEAEDAASDRLSQD